MKGTGLILLYMLMINFSVVVTAQQGGIQFEKGTNWEEMQAKAKSQGKYIFIDCYATWCGPCKFMNDSIFPELSVGTYINRSFISVQIQMDSTKKDNADVKRWYRDARKIEQQYKVKAYPTYLFLTPDGKLTKRIEGAFSADQFIKHAKDALSYSGMIGEYRRGKRDTTFLKDLAMAALDIEDTAISSPVALSYIRQLDNIYTEERLFFIAFATRSSRDTGFVIFRNNIEKIDEINGKDYAMRVIGSVINREDIKPALNKGISWETIQKMVIGKYPAFGEEVVLLYRLSKDLDDQDWEDYGRDVIAYMEKYADRRNDDPRFSNMLAWTAFLHCEDEKVLTKALEWAKLSISIKEEPWNYDTYANLLYKIGKVEEAILWEQKAIKLEQERALKEKNWLDPAFQRTLNKMQKGEPTWVLN